MRGSTNLALAGVMAGGAIMRIVEEQDRKDQEKATQKAAKSASRAPKAAASAKPKGVTDG